ncbi:uncharacterized protein LOC135226209 [Macrobrachium nipponense]|uniref:uncharacterized protein LOC135226209 n=1 Tax=Macrobrachium nipponense TaxID=159736 RepID=UPI0030C8428E
MVTPKDGRRPTFDSHRMSLYAHLLVWPYSVESGRNVASIDKEEDFLQKENPVHDVLLKDNSCCRIHLLNVPGSPTHLSTVLTSGQPNLGSNRPHASAAQPATPPSLCQNGTTASPPSLHPSSQTFLPTGPAPQKPNPPPDHPTLFQPNPTPNRPQAQHKAKPASTPSPHPSALEAKPNSQLSPTAYPPDLRPCPRSSSPTRLPTVPAVCSPTRVPTVSVALQPYPQRDGQIFSLT